MPVHILYVYIYLYKKETVATRRDGDVEISFYFPFPRRRNGWWKKTPRIPYINTQHLRTHALFARVYIKCSQEQNLLRYLCADGKPRTLTHTHTSTHASPAPAPTHTHIHRHPCAVKQYYLFDSGAACLGVGTRAQFAHFVDGATLTTPRKALN